jgi:hypothetical protein
MRYNLLVAPITVFVLFMFACSNSEDPEGPAPSVSSSSSEEQSVLQVSSSSLLISSSSSSSSARSSSSQASSSSFARSSSSSSVRSSSSLGLDVPIGCTRDGLEAAVNKYLAAMEAGDHTSMPLASNAKYIENDSRTSQFGQGLWETQIAVDFHRNLIDVQECATYTEIIAATQSYPYVIGTRLKVKDGEISEVYAIVTSKDLGWAFDAAGYLRYSEAEDWSEIPVNERLTREELRRAGFAYMEYFADKSVDVPWGIPCARLEGGVSTNPLNSATASCNVGVPDLEFNPVRTATYLVDVDYGMSVLFFNFGGPDSHWFRVLKNHGLRYIHTLTAMKNELPK